MLQGLGVVGTVLSNCLAFSNLPAILEARRRGSLGDLNPLVFPFLFGNCVSWVMYSVAKKVNEVDDESICCITFVLLYRCITPFCFCALVCSVNAATRRIFPVRHIHLCPLTLLYLTHLCDRLAGPIYVWRKFFWRASGLVLLHQFSGSHQVPEETNEY